MEENVSLRTVLPILAQLEKSSSSASLDNCLFVLQLISSKSVAVNIPDLKNPQILTGKNHSRYL